MLLFERKPALKKVATLALLLPTAAFGQVLWDNGPMSTGPISSHGTVAPTGTEWSELQDTPTEPANGTLGYSVNYQATGSTAPYRQGDDFVVAGDPWHVTNIVVYGFRTNGLTTESFSTGVVRIWNDRPDAAGAQVVAGDLTTNRLTSTTFTNLYRTGRSSSTTNRPIMAANLEIDAVLNPGTYWIEYGLTGAGNIFSPLVTVPDQLTVPDANAFFYTSQTYFAMTDSNSNVPLAVPFQVIGQPVPEPATLAALGMGALALIRRKRRS